MNTESDITKKTSYHINLFSDYGIRRNTQSDITKWRYMTGTERDGITKWAYMHRISAYTGDAACHLAMAYIDGNGAGVNIEVAKEFLALGEDRGHRFCIFKLAEIKIEEHILKTGGVSPSIHEEFNKLAEMARLGVGEACVSLHFFLKRYGQKLEAQGWECSKAYEITKKFMWALQLAYEYKLGEPYQRLVSALYDLGELGSGAAYFQAGQILEMNKHYVDALESYQIGAFRCLDKKCIRQFIVHTTGESLLDAIKWAKKNCPVPAAYFYEIELVDDQARKRGLDLSAPEIQQKRLELIEQGLIQCIIYGDLEDGLKVADGLLKGAFNLSDDNIRKILCGYSFVGVEGFLTALRRTGMTSKILDGFLSRITINDCNDMILEDGLKKEQERFKNKKEVSYETGLGLNIIDLEDSDLSDLEFKLIEEYGKLTLGCAEGNYNSHFTSMLACLYQAIINPRIKPNFIHSSRISVCAYAHLRGVELISGNEIKELKQALEVIPAEIRDSIDSHMANEQERWDQISSRQTFVDWIGRGARYSQRLFNEINYSHDTPAGQFQPWRPILDSKASPDQLALTWNQDVLSACPIDRDWILYPKSEERQKSEAVLEQTNLLAELAKAGKYILAKRAYTCWEFTSVSSGLGTNKRYTYEIKRADDSNQLAVIAREMLFRGDYEESEKIIDYLISTEEPPQGLLHHISAWLKYKQGKLSEAITMLQDCNVADLADSLGSTNVLEFRLLESRPLVAERTNANVLEYKLLVAELLLRDECLAQAADKIIKLKDICDKEQIYDVRISQLSEKIQLAHKQVTGQQVGLYQIAMSKMTNMLFTFSKNPIGMLQVPYFGIIEFPPNNMDRYRCLFPK